ncbi:unnamed protein product, partial [Meganyctiphanes norvegica]
VYESRRRLWRLNFSDILIILFYKRRVWHSNPAMQNPAGLSKQQVAGEGNNQRIHRLNKVFMEKISDIMSTGEVSSQLSGFGLEISKIRVLPDMRGINVYWICSGKIDTDTRVGEILRQNAASIRHELCQLSVLGRVPTITFVADHRFHKMAEVERRLAIADFGPDFIPTDASHHLKRELTLRTNLSDHLHTVLSESSNSPLNITKLSSSVEPPSMSPMRQDVMGVDTHKIYDMVRKKVTKARAEHRLQQGQESSIDVSNSYILDHDPDSVKQRTKEIKLWVDQYEQAKKKKERRLRQQDRQFLNVPRELQSYDQDINLDIYNEEDYEDNNNEHYDFDYKRE